MISRKLCKRQWIVRHKARPVVVVSQRGMAPYHTLTICVTLLTRSFSHVQMPQARSNLATWHLKQTPVALRNAKTSVAKSQDIFRPLPVLMRRHTKQTSISMVAGNHLVPLTKVKPQNWKIWANWQLCSHQVAQEKVQQLLRVSWQLTTTLQGLIKASILRTIGVTLRCRRSLLLQPHGRPKLLTNVRPATKRKKAKTSFN